MFDVQGQKFKDKKEAKSYAKTASSMFEGVFEVRDGEGRLISIYKGGRRGNPLTYTF